MKHQLNPFYHTLFLCVWGIFITVTGKKKQDNMISHHAYLQIKSYQVPYGTIEIFGDLSGNMALHSENMLITADPLYDMLSPLTQ